MAKIRPLMEDDSLAVAALFQRIFRRRSTPPPADLVSDFHDVYLEDPACDPDLPSLVHVDDDGSPCGFIGMHTLPMNLDGRPLRMALCSSIMVDGDRAGPLAGGKLLKAALGGPQDISFTDTASDVSLRMWRSLGGIALPQHSLDWVRVVNPATALVDTAASRLPFLRHLSPAAGPVDRLFHHTSSRDTLRWAGLPQTAARPNGPVARAIGVDELADILARCMESFTLKPAWRPEDVALLVRKAMVKPAFGEPVLAGVFDRREAPIGGFLYHLQPKSTARVLQLAALAGHEGSVFDALLADAAARRASIVRGRMQPRLMDTILGRRVSLLNVASSVIHSRDAAIAERVRSGDAFLNGLAGEQWSRLIGGKFD